MLFINGQRFKKKLHITRILIAVEFYMKSLIKKVFSKIKSYFDRKQAKTDLQILDELEKEPIYFGLQDANQKLMALANSYSGTKDNLVKQRVLALQYRLEILPLHFDRFLFEALRKQAEFWKCEQDLMPIKELNLNDLKELEKIAYHTEFAKLVLNDAKLQKDLFNWILRDQNEATVFIQFPALIQKINSCNLNGRLSCHGGHLLKIEKQKLQSGGFRKIVTLPFEGKPVNILDANRKIHFRGNVAVSIQEIFEVFKDKDYRVGNFEFMKDGIINWNIHHLGYWDEDVQDYVRVDLNKSEWWKQLPIFETLTLNQVRMRYGWPANGSNWIAAASATRGLANLSYEKTHAFLEIAIPLGCGKYGIYDFGKLAYKYPSSFLEMMDMFCKNVHATVAFPDENVFYSHRQHALHPFCLTSAQGFKLMDLIKQDILVARAYNFIYQIESENCAKWVQLKLETILGEQNVPNLYRMQLLNTEPDGPVSKIFALIKKLPENWQVPLLTTLHLPLGAAKKTWIEENGVQVAKSLKDHSFFNTGEVYLPAFMHDQLLKGSLKCPLGLHQAYFAVGLLSDKHKFGYLRDIILKERVKEPKESLSVKKTEYISSQNINRQEVFFQYDFTPLRL